MTRERVKLSEKEERILIQAKLMGLDTSAMVRIGNRLKALEKEADEIADINEAIHGFSWEKLPDGWRVKSPTGHVFKFTDVYDKYHNWYSREVNFHVVLEEGVIQKFSEHPNGFNSNYTISNNIKKKLCPEKSKHLYTIIWWVRFLTYSEHL